MRYIARTQHLEKDDGALIKKFDCPLDKKWNELMPWSASWDDKRDHKVKRFCGACDKCVIDFNGFSEEQIIGIVAVEPDACGYLRMDHPELREVVGEERERPRCGKDHSSCIEPSLSRHGNRVIHTARSIVAMKNGIALGCSPYFVSNAPSGSVWQKRAVVFDKEHRKVFVAGDYRAFIPFNQEELDKEFGKGKGIALRMDFHKNTSPFAAYLIPDDIQVGESVFVEDVIEDYVASSWSQGDTGRLTSCLATWDGEKLVLEVPSKKEVVEIMG